MTTILGSIMIFCGVISDGVLMIICTIGKPNLITRIGEIVVASCGIVFILSLFGIGIFLLMQ